MAIPEKHRPTAHAFVDGAQIQWSEFDGGWSDCTGTPTWGEHLQYRVKPEAPTLRLPAKTVEAIASYYGLMPATVEAVSMRVLRDAAELQLVVPMAEVQEVARQLAAKERDKRDLAVAEAVRDVSACRLAASDCHEKHLRSLIDIHAIIATVKD
jgi:hypothetical protein